MTSWLTLWLAGIVLTLLPFVAVLPLLAAFDRDAFQAQARRASSWSWVVSVTVGCGLIFALVVSGVQDQERLQVWGRAYGSVLQLLLAADVFVVGFLLLLRIWPRGGAVALAAFREGVRQPLFWLLALVSAFLLLISMVLPYFTFGDDYKMMKLIDFDIIMLFAALFAVVTASMSITEEIEGRTAITLLSKPLSRRQFLLGKFSGILLASLVLAALLGWCLNWVLYAKPILELDEMADPMQQQIQPLLAGLARSLAPRQEVAYFLEGVADWSSMTVAMLPNLLIACSHVMLFLAVAAALATRVPMAVNLLACLVVFFLGNLAPYLVQVSRDWQLVQFVARLGDTVLPALHYYNQGPAIVRDQPLPFGPYALHALQVFGYSVQFAAIALLFGLILFEDRDLA